MKSMMMSAAAAMLATTACSDMTASSDTASSAGVSGDMMSADATPTAAMPYVAMAGASDLYEIQSSQLALQKSRTPAIREYAQMMIDHHTKTTQDVTTAARAAGMNPPPPQLMPMQANLIAQLQPLSDAEFDRTYVTQQRQSHEMALALHTNYSRSGDTPPLRTAATGAVPIVQQHLTRIQQM